jgi:AmmeMemoRadiSam system protein B
MRIAFSITIVLVIFCCCSHDPSNKAAQPTRPMADTIGFAHLAWQTDSVLSRVYRLQSAELGKAMATNPNPWRVAICPHDDYAYVGWHYPAVLKNIKAKTVIIFGVAHKAKRFNLADRLVFESFDNWYGAYGPIKISTLRDELIKAMPRDMCIVHDSMHIAEHSVESMLPFLQRFNRTVEIVPILVPYMSFTRMQAIAKPLAEQLVKIMGKCNLQWGRDIALLITTDAVHYGDEEWGGKNYAPYGVDSVGYCKAVAFENEIIASCFEGELTAQRIERFFQYTVNSTDYREYQWTWCGRYCVPFGLLTAHRLASTLKDNPLSGKLIGYTTSIDHSPIPVEDLGMGRTAIATQRHWVGYASVGFE